MEFNWLLMFLISCFDLALLLFMRSIHFVARSACQMYLADKLQIDSCDFQAQSMATLHIENTPFRSQYEQRYLQKYRRRWRFEFSSKVENNSDISIYGQ